MSSYQQALIAGSPLCVSLIDVMGFSPFRKGTWSPGLCTLIKSKILLSLETYSGRLAFLPSVCC